MYNFGKIQKINCVNTVTNISQWIHRFTYFQCMSFKKETLFSVCIALYFLLHALLIEISMVVHLVASRIGRTFGRQFASRISCNIFIRVATANHLRCKQLGRQYVSLSVSVTVFTVTLCPS